MNVKVSFILLILCAKPNIGIAVLAPASAPNCLEIV